MITVNRGVQIYLCNCYCATIHHCITILATSKAGDFSSLILFDFPKSSRDKDSRSKVIVCEANLYSLLLVHGWISHQIRMQSLFIKIEFLNGSANNMIRTMSDFSG